MDTARFELLCSPNYMLKQWRTAHRVQYLGQGGSHPRALAGRKNNDTKSHERKTAIELISETVVVWIHTIIRQFSGNIKIIAASARGRAIG